MCASMHASFGTCVSMHTQVCFDSFGSLHCSKLCAPIWRTSTQKSTLLRNNVKGVSCLNFCQPLFYFYFF